MRAVSLYFLFNVDGMEITIIEFLINETMYSTVH